MAVSDKWLIVLGALLLVVATPLMFVLLANDEADIRPETDKLSASADLSGNQVRRRRGPTRIEKPVVHVEEEVKVAPIPILPEDGKIVGSVVDHEETGIPAVQIKVTRYFPAGEINYDLERKFSAESLTREDGQFTFDVPGTGAFRMVFSAPGFAPVVKKDIRMGDNLTIKMSPGGQLDLKVWAAETEKAIPNALVTLQTKDGVWTHQQRGDENGAMVLDSVPSGIVLLSVEARGYLPIDRREFNILPQTKTEQVVMLGMGRRIWGNIHDDNKLPLANAKVIFNISGQSSSGQEVEKLFAHSNELGEYSLSGLEKATYYLTIEADGFQNAHGTIRLAGSRESARFDSELSRGGIIEGDVIDDTGKPVADCEAKLFRSWGGSQMYSNGETRFTAKTDKLGHFRISGLSANSWEQYRIRFSKTGYANNFSEKFRLKSIKSPKNIQAVLSQGGRLGGVVYDDKGLAIADALVTLSQDGVYEWNSRNSKGQKQLLSDKQGKFMFLQLAPGKYRVSVTTPGFARSYQRRLEISGNAILDNVVFNLKRSQALKGLVKDEAGNPIKGASVWASSRGNWSNAESDEKGEFVLNSLGEDPCRVTVRCKGYATEVKRDISPLGDRVEFELRTNGYFVGRVVAKSNGEEESQPVRKFRVYLQKKVTRSGKARWQTAINKTFSDADGRFKVYAANGTYRLQIKARGFMTYTQEGVAISVDAEPKEKKIELVAGGAVEGWVRDYLGQGRASVQVFIRAANADSNNTNFQSKGYTEADGYFLIESLEAGSYDFVFYARNQMPFARRERVVVLGGEISRVDQQMQKPSDVQVRIETENGGTINWMRFILKASDGSVFQFQRYRGWNPSGSSSQFLDSKSYYLRGGGYTQIHDLPAGSYILTASRSGYETLKEEFEVPDSGAVILDLLLKKKTRKKN